MQALVYTVRAPLTPLADGDERRLTTLEYYWNMGKSLFGLERGEWLTLARR